MQLAASTPLSIIQPFGEDLQQADIDSSRSVQNMDDFEIRALLDEIRRADQQYRDSLYNGNPLHMSFYTQKIKRNDAANERLLHKLVTHIGWPSINRFGEEHAYTAWLVVWHHRNDLQILLKYLPFIEASYRQRDINEALFKQIVTRIELLESIK